MSVSSVNRRWRFTIQIFRFSFSKSKHIFPSTLFYTNFLRRSWWRCFSVKFSSFLRKIILDLVDLDVANGWLIAIFFSNSFFGLKMIFFLISSLLQIFVFFTLLCIVLLLFYFRIFVISLHSECCWFFLLGMWWWS